MQTLSDALGLQFNGGQVVTTGPNPVHFSNQKKLGFATVFVVTSNLIMSAGQAVWDDNSAPGKFEGDDVGSYVSL